MEQNDYLKRQIDQLGEVLAALLSKLTNAKGAEQTSETVTLVNQNIKTLLGIDIGALSVFSHANTFYKLHEQYSLTNEHLEILADIMLYQAQYAAKSEKISFLENCLAIYTYLQATEKNYSIHRHWKTEQIRKLITDNGLSL